MYSFFIGSDVSKDKIDVSCKSATDILYLGEFENNHSGFKVMLKALKKQSPQALGSWLFCFENTGAFSKPLFEWLYSQGIPCIEECPIKIKKSIGLKRGKDDKADSKSICNYGFEKRDTISPSKPQKPLIIKLKGFISRRDQLVKVRTALSNSLKSIHLTQDSKTVKYLHSQNDNLLKEIDRQIQDVEKKIQDTLEAEEKIKINNKLVRSVIGFGPVLAAKMIAITDNFESFRDGRKFACYTGVAPFPNSSGTVVKRNSISHYANKDMKRLLSIAVFSAITHDPDLKLYYKRKVAAGKPKGVVRNAVKNKMIHRVFSVINRQSPYIKIMNYAS